MHQQVKTRPTSLPTRRSATNFPPMYRIALIAISLMLACSAASAGEVTESYDVSVDGKKFTIDGAVTNLTVGSKNVAIGVQRSKFKKFDDGTLSFLFPSDHAVKAEKEADGMASWTLDGQDTVIMVHRLKDMDAQTFVKDVLNSMLETYGKSAKVEDCQKQFGPNLVKGKRINATLAGESITQDIFSFPGAPTGYVLVIQEGEKNSPEARLVNEKLKESFKIIPGK